MHAVTSPSTRVWPLSVAPMMDCTDRHFRALLRGITSETLLYTEMITTSALLQGDATRRIKFSYRELPLALQLGGDDPSALAHCAKRASEHGYVELDLNVGCPSPRVRCGGIGAVLMRDPDRVARCVAAMRAASSLPVTVKHRLGVDELDSFDALVHFVGTVAEAGTDGFIVHARKAVLTGLSPRDNRRVPPLRHDWVVALKRTFPDLRIELNGGVHTLEEAASHLLHVDGVMIGRAVRDEPMLLAAADRQFFGGGQADPTRPDVVDRYLPHLAASLDQGAPPVLVLRPLQHVYAKCPGARTWRRALATLHVRGRPGADVARDITAIVRDVEARRTLATQSFEQPTTLGLRRRSCAR